MCSTSRYTLLLIFGGAHNAVGLPRFKGMTKKAVSEVGSASSRSPHLISRGIVMRGSTRVISND